ncbi:MAG: hypothetical protein ACRD51_18980 [Candidatus Acidiferrum sp.]
MSIAIDQSEKTFSWRGFGYQNNYEPQIHGEHLKTLGPFEFDLKDYESKLIQALDAMKSPL